MCVFGQDVKNRPSIDFNSGVAKLRLELIREEFKELSDAYEKEDFLEVVDALTDLLYVVYGSGAAFGVDLDKCFEEVHSSNMSKLDEYGNAIYREDGKILKGPNYFKPNLEQFIR